MGATYSSCRCKALKWQNGTVFPSGLTALEPHWDPGETGARFCYTLPTKAIREECISVNDYSLTPWGLSAKGKLSLGSQLETKYLRVLLSYLWLSGNLIMRSCKCQVASVSSTSLKAPWRQWYCLLCILLYSLYLPLYLAYDNSNNYNNNNNNSHSEYLHSTSSEPECFTYTSSFTTHNNHLR